MPEEVRDPRHILIVEDSAIQAEMLKRLLDKEGYVTAVAKDGAEGLKMAEELKPTLIISDVNMPVMDGLQMCSEIKRTETLSGIPVLLLTQLFEPEEIIRGLEAGADSYVTKPYYGDYLASKIKLLLENPERFKNRPDNKSVEFEYEGKTYEVHSGRAQTLSFLISTYESAVWQNRELDKAQMQLKALNEHLEERTIQLEAANKELAHANEKLKEIDRLKSMFIASMSHELRTPLNAIIGFSSILLNEWTGPLNAEQKENMSIMLRSGKHLLALINDVIDVSKIEAGKMDVHIEEFDLCDVILEVVTLMKKDMDEKRLELKVESIHQKMHTDRQRLLQCVLNLVSNAVKFTEKGTIHVGAGLAPAQKQEGQPQGLPLQDFVEISVSDTGIGIKEEDIPKLFQSFVRLDSPLRSKVKGTGLGLYLTKKLSTDVLNGEITAASEYGKWSRFVIRVPVKL